MVLFRRFPSCRLYPVLIRLYTVPCYSRPVSTIGSLACSSPFHTLPVSLLTDHPLYSVGKFVVAALLHPEVSKNRALIVNSFTTTPHEIVKEFEKQTNSKWTVTYTSLDDLRKLEEESWEKGHPSAASMTLRRIWTEGGTLYDKMDNEELGVKETDTLKHQVKLVIEGTQ